MYLLWLIQQGAGEKVVFAKIQIPCSDSQFGFWFFLLVTVYGSGPGLNPGPDLDWIFLSCWEEFSCFIDSKFLKT